MTDISATKDSVATNSGRDSVVHIDDRTIYSDCTIHIYQGGTCQAFMLPLVLLLVLLILHVAHHPDLEVVATPYGESSPHSQIVIKIYTLEFR